MRRFKLTSLVLATLALSAAPAQAARHMEVGLQDDGAFVSEVNLKRPLALKLAHKLSVTRIRVNVPWAKVVKHARSKKRPKHRRYDFTSYDALLNAAKHRGIRLQLTISGPAPAWATGNHKVGGYKPKTGGLYREFVRTVVKHFGRHVDRYSIWNEPNYVSWLGPTSSGPRLYHELYTTAYAIIRKHNPRAKILIGETAPYGQSRGRATAPLEFLRKLVHYGKLRADGYAHHPYDFRHSVDYHYPGSDNVTITGLSRLTKQLHELAHEHKLMTPHGHTLDVYLTEYGYMASGKYKVSESKRGKYETKAFQIALDNSHVKEMTQYLLVKPRGHSGFFDTSIVSRKKGKPSKTFKALQHWTSKEAHRKRIAVPTQSAR